eukprot:jgi/Ulvmu1/4279/UM199_0001.1
MGLYDTAIVTVPAPYIGCAYIGGRPTGCPARGTAATLPGGRQDEVEEKRVVEDYGFVDYTTAPPHYY